MGAMGIVSTDRIELVRASWLLALLAVGLLGCGVGGARSAESPEEAVRLFLDAMESDSQAALKKVWWVSNDPAQVDEIIRVSLDSAKAMADFQDRLMEVYAEELEELRASGRVRKREPGGEITDDQIRDAVASPIEEKEGGERLTIHLEDRGLFYLGKHDDHWYVEHIFVTVDREWEPKDTELHRSMARVHRELLEQIGKDGVTAMDLLERQQMEMGRLAFQYGGPIMY
jgi:hypothetical protein